MPAPVTLEKAFLVALDPSGTPDDDTRAEVQFNPETLKVTFANQIAQPQGGGNQSGTDGQQFVGAGTTKLALQLWFDVTVRSGGDAIDDVRKLTQKVAFFITPKQDEHDRTKFLPPMVRFGWGTFQFDGIMEGLEESLEFFSSDGRPLRASTSFTLAQQHIVAFAFGTGKGGAAPPGVQNPGEAPLTAAPSGSSVQQLAASQGKRGSWQSIAEANRIENPRSLPPGVLFDMNARARSAGTGR